MNLNPFTSTVLSVLDRAINPKAQPITGTIAREEQAVRSCYEAMHGPNSADAIYQAALAKQIASLEDQWCDAKLQGRQMPPVPAAQLKRLKSEGLNAETKIRLLHNAMARPAAPAVAPTLPTMAPAAAPIPHQAPAAPPLTFNKSLLSALFDAVAGAGEAAHVTYHPVKVDLVKRSKAFAAVPRGSPVLSAEVAETFAREQQADEAAQAPAREKEDCECLKSHLLGLGVKVSGLSYAGLARPSSDVMELDPKTRAQAQKNADAFMAVLGGDPFAGASNELAAETARGLIRATNGEFKIGATLGLKSL